MMRLPDADPGAWRHLDPSDVLTDLERLRHPDAQVVRATLCPPRSTQRQRAHGWVLLERLDGGEAGTKHSLNLSGRAVPQEQPEHLGWAAPDDIQIVLTLPRLKHVGFS